MGGPALVGLLTMPYLIINLGVYEFGVLSLFWTLTGFLNFFDFGIGKALTKELSKMHDVNDLKEIHATIKSALIYSAKLAVLGFCLAIAIPNDITNFIGLDSSKSYNFLLWIALGIPINIFIIVFRGILEASQRFKGISILKFFYSSSLFIAPTFSIAINELDLNITFFLITIFRLIILIVNLYLVNNRYKITTIMASVGVGKKIFSDGLWFSVSAVISPILVNSDRLFISSILGINLLSYYAAPADMVMRLLILPGAIIPVLFPLLSSSLHFLGKDATKLIYYKNLKIVFSVLALPCLFISIWSYELINFWLGSDFAQKAHLLTSILAIGVLINGVAFVPSAAIQACSKSSITAILHIFEAFFYIPLVIILIKQYGIEGAAYAWLIRAVVDCVLLLIIAKNILK